MGPTKNNSQESEIRKETEPVESSLSNGKGAQTETEVGAIALSSNGSKRSYKLETTGTELQENLLNEYLVRIAKIESLNGEEFIRLAKRSFAGDIQARNVIVECNLQLVIPFAVRYQRQGLSLLELIQEGNIGLIKGVERFDPDRGFALSTYVAFWIQLEIRQALFKTGSVIRRTEYAGKKILAILQAERFLATKPGRPPTPKEIAKHLDLKVDAVRELLYLDLYVFKNLQSLQQPLTDSVNQDSFGDTVANPNSIDPMVEAIEKTQRVYRSALIQNEILNHLNGLDFEIIVRRFGFDGFETEMSVNDIAKDLGLNEAQVKGIIKKVHSRFRQNDDLHIAFNHGE